MEESGSGLKEHPLPLNGVVQPPNGGIEAQIPVPIPKKDAGTVGSSSSEPLSSLPGDEEAPKQEVRTSDVYKIKSKMPKRFDHPGMLLYHYAP
jgi:hypothetical protein